MLAPPHHRCNHRALRERGHCMKWVMSLGIVAMLAGVGCDQSKAELDSTKTTLASVTTERDNLKTQLATAQQQLDATKAELAKAKAAAAATPAVANEKDKAATAGKTTTPEKGKKAAHKS